LHIISCQISVTQKLEPVYWRNTAPVHII